MIPAAYLGVIEMGLTFAVVGGLLFQQLWSLRDTGAKPPEPPADDDPEDPPAAA